MTMFDYVWVCMSMYDSMKENIRTEREKDKKEKERERERELDNCYHCFTVYPFRYGRAFSAPPPKWNQLMCLILLNKHVLKSYD